MVIATLLFLFLGGLLNLYAAQQNVTATGDDLFPTIALNHCGMKDVICEKCGIRIDISSYDQVINDIADVLSDLLENPNKINILSEGVNECIGNFTWEMRRKLFNQFYNTAIENWKQKNETIYYARQQ